MRNCPDITAGFGINQALSLRTKRRRAVCPVTHPTGTTQQRASQATAPSTAVVRLSLVTELANLSRQLGHATNRCTFGRYDSGAPGAVRVRLVKSMSRTSRVDLREPGQRNRHRL